jgi:D-amino-acid dehydrogenase
MKILVLGGGVIGVTSAFYLNRAGHDVILLERRQELARETSFANGGQISWGSGHPWAAPGVPAQALRWMLKSHSPLVLRPRLDKAMWRWLAQSYRQCKPERFRENKERQLRLARYSHNCLVQLRDELDLDYAAATRGALVLHRDPQAFQMSEQQLPMLESLGIPVRRLNREGCIEHEPALERVADRVAGGLLFPEDESGDCQLFTEQLARHAEAAGVEIRTGTTALAVVPGDDRIEQVLTDRGSMRADAYVLACGSYSPLFLRPIGIELPIYPVKGYSITMTLRRKTAAPRGTITDELYKTVITRLGNRLRAAGTAELAGYDHHVSSKRIETLMHVVGDLFPEAGDLTRVETWTGLRPMTPDNTPVIGDTPYRNLFLNTGHGTLGWTMACGSGRVLADAMSGRSPEIDLNGLTLERYGKR